MKMINICFTKFPLGGLGEPNIYHQSVCLTRTWDFTWRVSGCEELEGVTHRGMMGLVLVFRHVQI